MNEQFTIRNSPAQVPAPAKGYRILKPGEKTGPECVFFAHGAWIPFDGTPFPVKNYHVPYAARR